MSQSLAQRAQNAPETGAVFAASGLGCGLCWHARAAHYLTGDGVQITFHHGALGIDGVKLVAVTAGDFVFDQHVVLCPKALAGLGLGHPLRAWCIGAKNFLGGGTGLGCRTSPQRSTAQ